MYFRLAKMATIVKGVKVFRKGLAALGTLVALMPLLSFAVLMYFVMTAEKTFHVRDQKSLLSFLDLSHRFLFHYRQEFLSPLSREIESLPVEECA